MYWRLLQPHNRNEHSGDGINEQSYLNFTQKRQGLGVVLKKNRTSLLYLTSEIQVSLYNYGHSKITKKQYFQLSIKLNLKI